LPNEIFAFVFGFAFGPGQTKQNKEEKKDSAGKRNTNLPTDLVYFIPKVDGFARERVKES